MIMKTPINLHLAIHIVAWPLTSFSQSATQTTATAPQSSTDAPPSSPADFDAALTAGGGKISYVVQKQGDGQVWETVSRSTNAALGAVGLTTNHVQQLGTGMHYFDGTAWKRSDATFLEATDE